MKRCILLIFSILICSAVSVAQVREFQIGAKENSIVRTVKGDSVLFFAKDTTGDTWFILYDESNASTKAFQFDIGFDVKVFDVKIYDENTAYFCGTIDWMGTSGERGLVGVFKVPDVFSGIGLVQCAVLMGNTVQKLYPMDLYRLDLLDSAGNICMAMTGKADYEGIGMYINTVVSAYYDGITWHSWILGHKGGVRFTDIACLDHLVAATGTYSSGTGCIVKTFRPTLSFPRDVFPIYDSYHLLYGIPAGTVLITKEKRDTAVVAHFDISSGVSTVLHRLPFNASSGSPILPVATMKTTPPSGMPFDTNWRMRELTVVKGETFLLQSSAFPPEPDVSFRDWRLKTIVPYSLAIEGWTPAEGIQRSMDVTTAMKTSSFSMGNFGYLQMHGPSWPTEDNACQINSLMNVETGVVDKELLDIGSLAAEIDIIYSASFSFPIIDVTEALKCYFSK